MLTRNYYAQFLAVILLVGSFNFGNNLFCSELQFLLTRNKCAQLILIGFLSTDLLFRKESIFFGKNNFLLEINILKYWIGFCWYFCFLFLKKFVSFQYERVSYSNQKYDKNAWFSINILVQFLNILVSGAAR